MVFVNDVMCCWLIILARLSTINACCQWTGIFACGRQRVVTCTNTLSAVVHHSVSVVLAAARPGVQCV